MAYILNIDSSAKNCSVALQLDSSLIASYDLFAEKSASSVINSFVERVLVDSGIALSNIDAISVGIGPGSYTGLRIAVSTAKGLSLGLDKPLIAVNTLEAMAYSQKQYAQILNALICPMIDARRMEVFCALFDHKTNYVEATNALVLDKDSFGKILENNNVLFLGDGSQKFSEITTSRKAFFIEDVNPSAKHMTNISYKKYMDSSFEDVAYLEPYYLKQFVSNAKT